MDFGDVMGCRSIRGPQRAPNQRLEVTDLQPEENPWENGASTWKKHVKHGDFTNQFCDFFSILDQKPFKNAGRMGYSRGIYLGIHDICYDSYSIQHNIGIKKEILPTNMVT